MVNSSWIAALSEGSYTSSWRTTFPPKTKEYEVTPRWFYKPTKSRRVLLARSLVFIHHLLKYDAENFIECLYQPISRPIVSRGVITFYLIVGIQLIKSRALEGG